MLEQKLNRRFRVHCDHAVPDGKILRVQTGLLLKSVWKHRLSDFGQRSLRFSNPLLAQKTIPATTAITSTSPNLLIIWMVPFVDWNSFKAGSSANSCICEKRKTRILFQFVISANDKASSAPTENIELSYNEHYNLLTELTSTTNRSIDSKYYESRTEDELNLRSCVYYMKVKKTGRWVNRIHTRWEIKGADTNRFFSSTRLSCHPANLHGWEARDSNHALSESSQTPLHCCPSTIAAKSIREKTRVHWQQLRNRCFCDRTDRSVIGPVVTRIASAEAECDEVGISREREKRETDGSDSVLEDRWLAGQVERPVRAERVPATSYHLSRAPHAPDRAADEKDSGKRPWKAHLEASTTLLATNVPGSKFSVYEHTAGLNEW